MRNYELVFNNSLEAVVEMKTQTSDCIKKRKDYCSFPLITAGSSPS
ncbi:hypothetical protein Thicy_0993 [Thiomicrospira cyclica ALM1]|uniref:Uncharacterized protein n=1 Tax=Thiomicrospira cyclica (strain DSM 14477 / JCM 11371 / ALM1) TaxID=717773 RepID=F6DD24_THICA|nr:hypothetical protein Thicy_0993 [Thiomicrospira cyclica ALM1]